MAVPRPVLIALLGLALIAGLFVVSRGAQDSSGTVTAAPAAAPRIVPAPAKSAPAKHAAITPKTAPARPAAPRRSGSAPATKATAQSGTDARLQPVLAAYERGDVVVLFFSQGHSADDAGARLAVASLAHQKGVSVFSAGLADLALYRPLLAQVGVSQVPALVVTRKGQKARLVQGFVDPGTLRQTVADARG